MTVEEHLSDSRSTLRKRYERASAASGEPQTARVAAARPVQHPGSRRLPTAADAEAMGVQWDKPTRRHRCVAFDATV